MQTLTKRILVFVGLALLVAWPSQAEDITVVIGQPVAAAGPSYADITFWLNFENSGGDPDTGDYTMGASECSDGDTTGVTGSGAATASAAARYGTYGLDCPTDGDEADFDVSSDDIVSGTKGSIGFNVRVTDFTNYQDFLRIYKDVNNDNVALQTVNTDELRVRWRYGSSNEGDCITSGEDLQTATWYHIQVFYDASTANDDYIIIEVNGSPACSATGLSLTPFAGASAFVAFAVGERNGGVSSDYHVDNVMMSDDPTRDWYDSGLYDDTTVVGLTDACDG